MLVRCGSRVRHNPEQWQSGSCGATMSNTVAGLCHDMGTVLNRGSEGLEGENVSPYLRSTEG